MHLNWYNNNDIHTQTKYHYIFLKLGCINIFYFFKKNRHVIERLKRINIPRNLREGLKSLILSSYGDKFSDNEELLPMCYRCSTTNPLLNPRGNNCITCNHPFIFSFVSFGKQKKYIIWVS